MRSTSVLDCGYRTFTFRCHCSVIAMVAEAVLAFGYAFYTKQSIEAGRIKTKGKAPRLIIFQITAIWKTLIWINSKS